MYTAERVFWKIRDTETGLYKERGMWGKWSKQGAEWASIGDLKRHLTMIAEMRTVINWKSWELVEFHYEPVEVGAKPLLELLK